MRRLLALSTFLLSLLLLHPEEMCGEGGDTGMPSYNVWMVEGAEAGTNSGKEAAFVMSVSFDIMLCGSLYSIVTLSGL